MSTCYGHLDDDCVTLDMHWSCVDWLRWLAVSHVTIQLVHSIQASPEHGVRLHCLTLCVLFVSCVVKAAGEGGNVYTPLH